ncbi:MAG: hypothetical protein IJ305_08100, partial [Oscillospiraceae bacterium]|nr:hypothetical protein [Oscillospiraceae bacterium]
MKKLIRKIAAFSAAVVMAVSAFGANASAAMLREDVVDSWEMTEKGWVFVMPDGKDAVNRLVKIDGVMYQFDDKWANQYEKYSGWTKSSDGTRRRYVDGLPYTGWLKYKNGQRRYCLDGYMATDNMQIGDHIYTFDENGFYTGKTALTLITKCDKIVSSDTDEIKVALKNLDGRDYNFGVLSSMERWEKGEWVNCWGDWKGENGEELAYIDIGYSLENKGDIMELDFNPQLYTNYNFTEGYYRIPIGSWIKHYKNQYECYATFQVVPPVTVEASEEIYFIDGTEVDTEVKITFNSQKVFDSISEIPFAVYKMTGGGWENASTYYDDGEYVYDEYCCEKGNGNGAVVCGLKIDDGIGYYKYVVTVNGEEYESYFRIGSMAASSWLDEYSKNDENLTICLNVYNSGDETKTICKDTYNLYEKKNGKWKLVKPDYELPENEPDEGRYVEIGSKQAATVYAHISEAYDTSEFKLDGHGRVFAVYISGCGFVPVALSNMELSKENFPFADLDANELEKVKMKVWCGSTVVETTENADDLKDIAAVLRQLELSDKAEAFPDAEG